MIETERLKLMPLNHRQLLKYIKNDGSLEEELNLYLTSRVISKELEEALQTTILPNVLDINKDPLYTTLWSIISKNRKTIVGDICFIGEPNSKGEVEIGYGTYEEFQGQGYMTETVEAMINWAKKQAKVKTIVASTYKNNVASFSVLIKNNFIKTNETENMFHWKLELKN